MHNGFIKLVLGAICFILISGCGKPVYQSDLIGTYTADYGAAKETLVIYKNGEFSQQVTLKSNSKGYSTRGKWQVNGPVDKGVSRIFFSDGFLSVLDGFSALKPEIVPSNASMPVLRLLGKIQIGGDPAIEYTQQLKP